MRITSVELHPTNSSDVAVLSFRDPGRQNPYNVKGIVGLDADEIVPRYYAGSGSSAKYNLSMEKRNIVVNIGLNPRFELDESYSGLRDSLYKLIASSRTGFLQIQFKNGTDVVAAISGFITKFETAHFEKAPEIHLTIRCDDPTLRALTPVDVDVSGLDPSPFVIQDDLSTAPHGFSFEITFLNNLQSFSLTDPFDPTWSFVISPQAWFVTDDVLHFSSEYNNKYLYVVRAGVTIYLADAIVSGSIWPILFPGANSFFLENANDLDWNAVSYYPTYWGV